MLCEHFLLPHNHSGTEGLKIPLLKHIIGQQRTAKPVGGGGGSAEELQPLP